MEILMKSWKFEFGWEIEALLDQAQEGVVNIVVIKNDIFARLTQRELEKIITNLFVQKGIWILVIDCKATPQIEKIALGFDFCLTTMAENAAKSYINRRIDGQEIEKGVREFVERLCANKQEKTIAGIVTLFKKYRQYQIGFEGNCEDVEEKLFLELASQK